MEPILTPDQFEVLSRLDACTLANAIETFHVRLRNEGFTDHSIHCLLPQLPPVLGYAATIRIRGSAPPTDAGEYADRTDWWEYLLSLPSPRIVVVQDTASRPALGAFLGTVHINILYALGCVGAVTDGAVRGLPAATQLGFQLFGSGVTVSHAYVHVVEFGAPVEVAGLKIRSGDLVHGDVHGVQTIPASIAAQIPSAAARLVARDQALISLCRGKAFSIEKLRAAFGDRNI
jgi:regulator of RNase E activity RraA